MFNAISMHDDEVRPSPWRALGILLLLAALVYSCWHLYQRRIRAYQPPVAAASLTVANTLAEEAEDEMADGQPIDLPTFDKVAAPLFQSAPSLAAVRLWTPVQQLTGEITRQSPTTPQAGEAAVLPNLGANAAMSALRGRLADTDWVDTAAQIKLLQDEQSDISDTLSQPDKAGDEKALCERVYEKQHEEVLPAAQALQASLPLLAPAIADMNTLLDKLNDNEGEAPTVPLTLSRQVEDDLSAALGQYRATFSLAPGLPADLAAAAPAPATRLTRLLPYVSGQRTLMPLFISDENDQLTPAGFSEEIFYYRPADALYTLTWKQYAPTAALLFLLLLLLCWPQRRVVHNADEDD